MTLTIAGAPSGWTVNGATQNTDGSWTVTTADVGSLTISTPATYVGAHVLSVTESWSNADGSTGGLHFADNIEAYAPGTPIFAWSGDDILTGSSAADLFVFANPIGHDTIHGFDTASDRIDLIAYKGIAGFADMQSHLGTAGDGSAVLTLGDGQIITLDGVHAAGLTADNFAFDLIPAMANVGTIAIDDGAMLPLSGAITNSGTIALNSTGEETDLQLVQHGVTLDGHGLVVLSDNSANTIFGTAADVTLVNVDNTMSGAGHFGECVTPLS